MHSSQVAHQARAFLGFLIMKRLGVHVFLLPPGWDDPCNIKFAGFHLHSRVERGTVRYNCLTQEHNTMSLARAQTWTTQSGNGYTNH